MSQLETRERWTDKLLHLLRDAEPARHRDAARLLELFATPSRRAALEAIAVDDARDGWVRIYVLRALRRSSLSLSRDGLAALLRELAGAERRSELTRGDHLLLVIGVAAEGDEDAVREALATLAPPVARDLLVAAATSAVPLPAPLRDAAYRRCRETGALDVELAWHTLDQPASRALVLDRAPLDVERLRRASRKWSVASVAATFAERAAMLAAAIDQLALPLDVLRAHASAERLTEIAMQRVRDLDDKGRPAGVAWVAVRILADAPDALDALIADVAIDAAVREACVDARAAGLPTHELASVPRGSVARRLRWLHQPAPEHRALLVWAAASDEPAFRYVGWTGLLSLDGPEAHAASIDRLVNDAEPLLRLVALGAQAARGDRAAVAALEQVARSADHVVVRARAVRSLAALPARPADLGALCASLLRGEPTFYDLYYTPLAAEAALALARHPVNAEPHALDALVAAGLALACDDGWWAIAAAIGSWVDGTPAQINPLWYWSYLYPEDRCSSA